MVHNNWNTGLINNTTNYNINIGIPQQLPPAATELFQPNSPLSNFVSGFEAGFYNGLGFGVGQAVGQATAQALTGQTCPCSPPAPADSSHPQGSLKVDDKGVITTPGGYQIEALSQFEWKVTGPDGKSTRVWGDPHVDEGDGGKWDFKRDSTFVLADGTKINVTCKPYGNDMTVTAGLEIISGNDRVQVSDIDKGKGKVGTVSHDGFAHANSFSGKDTFVMGQETDDWSFQGKEVIGSEKGGETFKLGKDLRPLVDTTTKYGGTENYTNQLMKDVLTLVGDMLKMLGSTFGNQSSPILPQNTTSGNKLWEGNTAAQPQNTYNPTSHKNALADTIRAFGEMLKVISQMLALTSQVRRPPVTSA
jgi:hypothetical protein